MGTGTSLQELDQHGPGKEGEGYIRAEPLPIWVHLRTQAGDTGQGQILHLSDEGRHYETVVEGKNSDLEEMLSYLEAGERFLHGTRTHQVRKA